MGINVGIGLGMREREHEAPRKRIAPGAPAIGMLADAQRQSDERAYADTAELFGEHTMREVLRASACDWLTPESIAMIERKRESLDDATFRRWVTTCVSYPRRVAIIRWMARIPR